MHDLAVFIIFDQRKCHITGVSMIKNVIVRLCKSNIYRTQIFITEILIFKIQFYFFCIQVHLLFDNPPKIENIV